jgi:hypothetical protein
MNDDRLTDRDLADRELYASERARRDGLDREETTIELARRERDREREVAVPREHGGAADVPTTQGVPLLSPDATNELRARWMEVQTGFVDEPRNAVQQADALVAEAIQLLGESFTRARASLEREWDRGDDVSTEDLRQALQRYRAFFSRVLEV